MDFVRSKIRGAEDSREYRVLLGGSARQLEDSLAWQTMRDNILALRDFYFQKFTVEGVDANENRKAIVVMESILKMPAALVEDGNRARES